MNTDNFQELQQEESIDLKALFFKFYHYWYFFAITVFITLIIAFLVNKYTKPIYKVTTTVLIEDDKSAMDPQSLIGFGLSNNQQNLENEIGILKSYSLSFATVKSLDFNVSYFLEDNFIRRELYPDSPFEVILDASHPQAVGLDIQVSILEAGKIRITAEGEKVKLYDFNTDDFTDQEINHLAFDKTYNIGQNIEEEYFAFKILLTNSYKQEDFDGKKLSFVLNDIESLVKRFLAFAIEPINREASILTISLEGNNTQKSVDFLNQLTYEYLKFESAPLHHSI
jgi:tyrosine-protein kinase Etk/Wzc